MQIQIQTQMGLQCHTSGAYDSGYEGGNFTATPYQELASQPDEYKYKSKSNQNQNTNTS